VSSLTFLNNLHYNKNKKYLWTYPDSNGVSGASGVSLDKDCALDNAAPGDKVDGVLGVDRPDPPPPASPPPIRHVDNNYYHHPINAPTAGEQAFLMDYT
jgi:hypothetical protein